MRHTRFLTATVLFSLFPAAAMAFGITGSNGTQLEATEIATFEEPWAMTFLPDGTKLVTDKSGVLYHVTPEGSRTEIGGMWEVAYGGQGGLGDVVPHPDFASNNLVYISFAEAGAGGNGAVVNRARLDMSGSAPQLTDITRIWEQPKVRGNGHYGHRIAFGPDGMLYITSGDRRALDQVQDTDSNIGTVVRLNADGTVPADNPLQSESDVAKSFWTWGHRNPLGIAFDPDGQLWVHEMGPRHGDELNLIVAGNNYGWPVVSNGNHYSGVPIPDHDTRPEFEAPKAYWVPSIAPSGLVIYDGDVFGDWQGDALIGGLAGQALIHVSIDGETASETERFEWGSRVREVELAPDGSVYVLEDNGRMLRLMPAG